MVGAAVSAGRDVGPWAAPLKMKRRLGPGAPSVRSACRTSCSWPCVSPNTVTVAPSLGSSCRRGSTQARPRLSHVPVKLQAAQATVAASGQGTHGNHRASPCMCGDAAQGG